MFFLYNSEPFVIFSGGLSYDKAGRRPTLTIMHGKAITVLEMDYPIVEFMALCETPYNNGKSIQRRVITYLLDSAQSLQLKSMHVTFVYWQLCVSRYIYFLRHAQKILWLKIRFRNVLCYSACDTFSLLQD